MHNALNHPIYVLRWRYVAIQQGVCYGKIARPVHHSV